MSNDPASERLKWQFGVIRNLESGEVDAATDVHNLTRAEAGQVVDGYLGALRAMDAAGHQLDEGIYVGGYSREEVATAIADLISITPAGWFGVAVRAIPGDE